jgi:hypothetical protein
MIARLMKGIVLLATALLPTPVLGQVINQKVVEFCESHLGQKVDSGQCSALAWAALRAAHAKELNDYKHSPGEGDYVWGRLVYTLAGRKGRPGQMKGNLRQLRPGDVVQYRNAVFRGKGYSLSYGHHTSVIAKVNPARRAIEVFEQNVNGRQTVGTATLKLNDLHEGWIRVYRPQPVEPPPQRRHGAEKAPAIRRPKQRRRGGPGQPHHGPHQRPTIPQEQRP